MDAVVAFDSGLSDSIQLINNIASTLTKYIPRNTGSNSTYFATVVWLYFMHQWTKEYFTLIPIKSPFLPHNLQLISPNYHRYMTPLLSF